MKGKNKRYYTDLCDGRTLLKLLEVLSGDKWAKPSRGTMRFHQLENNEKVFSYLRHAKVRHDLRFCRKTSPFILKMFMMIMSNSGTILFY